MSGGSVFRAAGCFGVRSRANAGSSARTTNPGAVRGALSSRVAQILHQLLLRTPAPRVSTLLTNYYSTHHATERIARSHRSRPVSAQFSRPQMIPPPRPASAAIRNGRISQRQDPLHCATQRPDPRHTRAVPQDDERPPMPPWYALHFLV